MVACLILTAAILWFGFFNQGKDDSEVYTAENTETSQDEINIDFSVLKNPLLKELQPFPEIQPLGQGTSTGSKGKENPFLPY